MEHRKIYNRKDFSFIVNNNGFSLFYKGIGIGEYNGKPNKSKKISMAIKTFYTEEANKEITNIIMGQGQQKFKTVIERIDYEKH